MPGTFQNGNILLHLWSGGLLSEVAQLFPHRRHGSHREPIFRSPVSWVSSKLTFPAPRGHWEPRWNGAATLELTYPPLLLVSSLLWGPQTIFNAIGHWVSPSACVWVYIGAWLQNKFITKSLQSPRLYLLYSFLICSNWITSIGRKKCIGVIMPPVYNTLVYKCAWVTYMIILLHCLHFF